MFYDCHVHSKFSPDGKSTMLEYSRLIDDKQLRGIGFAEHLDFLPECGAYGFLDYDAYTASVRKFRDMGYEFYAGAEIDYAKQVEKDILKTIKEKKYDFTICSIHTINGFSVSDRGIDHFYDKNAFYSMLQNYYKELMESLNVQEFDAIGHIGVYKRYLDSTFFSYRALDGWVAEMDNEAARACASSGKIIEVNSSGLFAVSASTSPGVGFLKDYYQYGGRTVCMSSDAHHVSHAGRGFDVVKEILVQTGFQYLYLPWDRENPIKIV